MKKSIPHRISLPIVFFTVVTLAILALFATREDDLRVAEAEGRYKEGESASTIAERKQAFNRALELYQELEGDYHPQFGTGRLYYNLANTYFQLEEYPWAILNYQRAQELMPREQNVKLNLAVARRKLSLDQTAHGSAFSDVFFFYSYLSLPEKLQLFFVFALLSLGFSTAYLWTNNRWLRVGTIVALCLFAVLFLNLSYLRYFSPVQGVLIKTSDLYRDAGTQYAKVGDRPIAAGTTVEVLNTQSDDNWLKIASPQGDPGFISNEAIRLIH